MAKLFFKAKKRLKHAAKYVDVDPDVMETLKSPQETLHDDPGFFRDQPQFLFQMSEGVVAASPGSVIAPQGAAQNERLSCNHCWRRMADHVGVFVGHPAHHRVVGVDVGVSDSKSAIYDPDGMDPYQVMRHKTETGSVCGAPTRGTRKEISNQELLECECDVLAPGALENQITEDNADRIKSRVVLELANGPVTPLADRILNAKGIIVVPDILANAGGVTVSYFEWAQNRSGYYWPLDEVHEKMHRILQRQSSQVWKLKEEKAIDMRTAAYVLALKRIGEAVSAHGTRAFFRRS